jgi:hypothetical protein
MVKWEVRRRKASIAKGAEVKKTRKEEPRPFVRMTTEELQAATAEFDREMVVDDFRPVSARARSRLKKARRRPGRPRQGEGAKVISVTVEKSLLARSDALAKNMGVTRAGMIARGLKAVLAAEGKL